MERKIKKINLELPLDMPSDAAPMEIVREIEKISTNLNPQIELRGKKIDEIKVRFTDKGQIDLGYEPTGYECKLWEKATCKVANDKEDLISNPIIMEKIKTDLTKMK